ncbi:MAG: MBOAT family O-acyltransferase [Terriglobia bacterium]|jgi:alginate O-acetyltransferase complex protein AlgI
MVFTTHIFVFYFLPLFLLVYFNLPYRWRNFFITLVSYVFYGWWKPWFVILMMTSTIMDFTWARIIARPGASARSRKAALLACCAMNLGFLGFFKYYMFSAESLNSLLQLVGMSTFRILRVTLPIGISFYTFHSLSYVIDVYRGHAKPAKHFFDYACFVALFPDLVAGPIIRYRTLADQISYREHTLPRFASGVSIFILGFAKKILLANTMGNVADAVFNAAAPGMAAAWAGVLAFAFQIYFDFCGYSDMAVGLGRMMGFEFMKNFDAPYRSESITELWRRWHISLSSVLRDYLYLPLGGNRKGELRTYINVAIVMLLGGLWHGAHWQFVVWGGYHGALLALERWRGKKSFYESLPRAVRIANTFMLMLFSWVLFRASDLTAAARYFGAMFKLVPSNGAAPLLWAEIFRPHYLGVMAFCAFLVFQPLQAFDWSLKPQTWRRVAYLVPLFLFSLMIMFNQAFNPFLYFQF